MFTFAYFFYSVGLLLVVSWFLSPLYGTNEDTVCTWLLWNTTEYHRILYYFCLINNFTKVMLYCQFLNMRCLTLALNDIPLDLNLIVFEIC